VPQRDDPVSMDVTAHADHILRIGAGVQVYPAQKNNERSVIGKNSRPGFVREQ
jgi:hypothetical protein